MQRTEPVLGAIRRGEMIVSADFNAMQMGSLAAECALRHLSGVTVPREIMLPVQLVDRGNCALWDRPYEERACAEWGEVVRARPD